MMRTVEISEDTYHRLESLAQARGISVEETLEFIIREAEANEAKMSRASWPSLSQTLFPGSGRPRTLDEILAPFRAQVEASGMTGEELETSFEEIREKRFQELQRQR
jgi:hypothetical protein